MRETMFLDKLSQGKPRSNHIVYELLPIVIENQELQAQVLEYSLSADPIIQNRCIHLLEKISQAKPRWIMPHKAFIFESLMTQKLAEEAKWSLAKIIPALALNQDEAEQAFTYCLHSFKNTDSRISMALMLEAIVSIAKYYPAKYAYQANQLLDQALHSPIPALSARARKLSKLRSSYVKAK